MKVGELQTTQDINQKFLMGKLKGDEVWAFEDDTELAESEPSTSDKIKKEIDKDYALGNLNEGGSSKCQ